VRVVLLIGFLWLGYVYLGYPLILACIARLRRVMPFTSDCEPSVSVLIAARNEEKDIGWKIEETLAWNYPSSKLEILVASDASDDGTDEIVRRYRDSRVTLLRMDRRGGKARALNLLAPHARGEVLLFTDANAHIGPDALRLMVRHFADQRVGAVTGDSRPLNDARGAVDEGSKAYWSYESFLKRLEHRLGSVLVCDGAIFGLRATLYQPLDPELANDLELPMRAGAAGYWITHEPTAVVFERETSSPLEEFARRRRISAQGMLAMIRLRRTMRGLRGWQFASHKFLRWLSAVPMLTVWIGSAAVAPESRIFAVFFAMQTLFYLLGGIALALTWSGRQVPKICAVPFYVLLGAVSSLFGVAECVAGRRFDVWEIAALSRGTAGVTAEN
jgi:cellulose synthase/poly-beta-1,6-N-acetylglucosamine synthase-like glycosyltransferase